MTETNSGPLQEKYREFLGSIFYFQFQLLGLFPDFGYESTQLHKLIEYTTLLLYMPQESLR